MKLFDWKRDSGDTMRRKGRSQSQSDVVPSIEPPISVESVIGGRRSKGKKEVIVMKIYFSRLHVHYLIVITVLFTTR